METQYGFNGRILHVDLSGRSTRTEEPDPRWYRIYAGGGLLGAYYLMKETQPGVDALDPGNLLIFASSVIAGQDGPGLARFSVVAKSPLSGGIGETRGEGPFGAALKASGWDAIIFHGRAERPTYLLIEHGTVSFMDAAGLWGEDTGKTTRILEERHGGRTAGTGVAGAGSGASAGAGASSGPVQVAAIGVAGERLVRYASIVTAYSIQAMRTGVGAVMGSKNLKALVLSGGTLPAAADPAALKALQEDFAERMAKNTLSMWQKSPPGFSASADLSDFDTAYIGADNYTSNLRVANSNYTRAAYLPFYKRAIPCPGCPNDCIKIIDPGTGYEESAGIHQEVTGALGPNIGNGDLRLMLEANVRCNLHGIDPVSLGFTLSFAMECADRGIIGQKDMGNLPFGFGKCENLLALIDAVAHREGIGDLLAEGSKRAAARLGKGAEQYALHVKGIEMVSFEPRTQTNLALGYATAPIGPRYDICEHDWDFDTVSGWEHTLDFSRTLGILERIPMQTLGKEKVRNFKALNNLWSAFDALDLCVFAGAPTRLLSMEHIPRLIKAVTGWESSSYELMRWGERRNHLMRLYNIREGLTAADDTLPQRFFREPIAYGRLEGTRFMEEDFKAAVELYYRMMGWDARGVPLEATLYDHHLEWACAKAGR